MKSDFKERIKMKHKTEKFSSAQTILSSELPEISEDSPKKENKN